MSTEETTSRQAGTPDSGCSVFRCVGNHGGCRKEARERCTITIRGEAPRDGEKLYMCPFNHWRSARWERTPNAEGQGCRASRHTLAPLVGLPGVSENS